MFNIKQNKILSQKISDYLQIADEAMASFDEAFSEFLANGSSPDFDVLTGKNTQLEDEADSTMHNLENFLYEKSLLPESREDMLLLFDAFDDIIDGGYHILKYIYTRNLTLPPLLISGFSEMLKISNLAYRHTNEAVVDLFGKRENVKRLVTQINNLEAVADEVQYRLIKEIFDSSEIDHFNKILLSELVTQFSRVADSCEEAGDIISIIHIKRVI